MCLDEGKARSLIFPNGSDFKRLRLGCIKAWLNEILDLEEAIVRKAEDAFAVLNRWSVDDG